MITVTELLNLKEDDMIIYTGGFRYFTKDKPYKVYESPVGRTVQNDNGVNKFIFELLECFDIKKP